MKPTIKEVIVVEGKYDKNQVLQAVNAKVITCEGFSIFHNKEKGTLLRSLALSPGIIILADSDGAGLVIRNHIKGMIQEGIIKQAYIPPIKGKEKRKDKPGKEGLLGVEGMQPSMILDALVRAGATIDKITDNNDKDTIRKSDFLDVGLIGDHSKARREQFCENLSLPKNLSVNALLEIINILLSKEEFLNETGKLRD